MYFGKRPDKFVLEPLDFAEDRVRCCYGRKRAIFENWPDTLFVNLYKFRQHVADSQNLYASILRQNSAPPRPQDEIFTFLAAQLVNFEANVAIQVAQPQVCYARTQLTRSQVCVAEFLKLPKLA